MSPLCHFDWLYYHWPSETVCMSQRRNCWCVATTSCSIASIYNALPNCLSREGHVVLVPFTIYSMKLLREKTFRSWWQTNCKKKLLRIARWWWQKLPCPQILQRKVSRIATKPQNLQKFFPLQFSAIHGIIFLGNFVVEVEITLASFCSICHELLYPKISERQPRSQAFNHLTRWKAW